LAGNVVYCNVLPITEIKEWRHIAQLRAFSLLMDGVLHATQGTNITGGKSVTTTTNGTRKGSLFPHINMCGRNIMDLFRKGFKFITKTMTQRITTSAIWSWLIYKVMPRITLRNGWQKALNSGLDFTPQELKQQKHGINLTRGEHGIGNTPSGLHQQEKEMVQNKYVHGVVSSLSALRLCERKAFAGHLVKEWRERLAEWTMSREVAPNAEQSLLLTNTQSVSFAARPVCVKVSRGKQKNATVYNLTVEHDNEYYANGVLVHNCDSLQYLSLGCLRIVSDREEDVRPTRDEDIDWYA
jgi:intein C-terminal splicing region